MVDSTMKFCMGRCKKCSDMSEVSSGGRAENENVKNERLSDL